MTDLEYFKKVFNDADDLKVSVRWNFDEQQADGFHHGFNSHEFFKRLRNLIREQS